MKKEIDDIDGLILQAEDALQAGDIARLIVLYERMALHGAVGAVARIGELYETGYRHRSHTFEKNLDQAVEWYQKAILENNDPLAHLGLGRIYYEGSETLRKDMVKAGEHLRIAYENKLPQAGIYLGAMSMFGTGVVKNVADAEKFFLTAATGGFPIAYRYLANMAASSGRFIRTIEMLIKEFIYTLKLKIQDRDHPNLWSLPK
ncbi:MAG TPA: tetratricopeptide repeat protein [Telluria sp.]|jgi:TPR repeat protein